MTRRTPRAAFIVPERPTLAAWLTPQERAIVAVRLAGRVSMLDIGHVGALGRALATGQAHAVLASAARLDAPAIEHLAAVRRAFPGIPLIGLITRDVHDSVVWRTATLCRLGADTVADVAAPGPYGWPALSEALDRMPSPLIRRVFAVMSESLPEATPGWFRFIAAAFRGETTMVKEIAVSGRLSPGRFSQNFTSVRLPAPRLYLQAGLLARLAYLAESTTWSFAAISRAANASSPQALDRAVRRLTGMNAKRWRRECGLAWALEDFCKRLIAPYCELLRRFDPFVP
jgi:hypothetical protein